MAALALVSQPRARHDKPAHVAVVQSQIHRANASLGIEFIDKADLEQRLGDLLEHGFALFDAFDIPPADAEASANIAINTLI